MPSLVLSVPLVLLIVASICDLRTREVPDWISASILAWAAAVAATGCNGASFVGLGMGLALGFCVGSLFFALGALGGADVKLLAALGAVTGPAGLVSLLLWVALAGGVLSLVAAARRQRNLAYVPAIAVGLFIYLVRNEAWNVWHR